MSKIGKVILGWFLICVVIAMFDSVGAGIATFVVGVGLWLLGSALADWISEIDARERNKPPNG